MVFNLNETVNKIKSVGSPNVRSVPMQGNDPVNGLYQIEIYEGGVWKALVSGLKKPMAEDIIRQALNRVILG